jgi:hypothetical protein
MSRVNSEASRLIELYCEIELNDSDEEPNVTKIYPNQYADVAILKLIGNFAFPFRNKIEK